MPEMHEQPPEVVAVLVDAVVHLLDVWLLQEADHLLLELTTAFARDDLHDGDPLVHCFLHDVVQRAVDVLPLVEDIVEVEFQFGHAIT